jgi:hypothetical protein
MLSLSFCDWSSDVCSSDLNSVFKRGAKLEIEKVFSKHLQK